MGTGAGKGGGGMAQTQNPPAAGTANYGNGMGGTGSPGGKGQGKGAGGTPQQQQLPQGLPQSAPDMQKMQAMLQQGNAMQQQGMANQDQMKQQMASRFGGIGGLGGGMPPQFGGGMPPQYGGPRPDMGPNATLPGPTGANFLGGDPGAISPAATAASPSANATAAPPAAATGASPGGPLSGRMGDAYGGFGGYGRFNGFRNQMMGRYGGGGGGFQGGGFGGGAAPAGAAGLTGLPQAQGYAGGGMVDLPMQVPIPDPRPDTLEGSYIIAPGTEPRSSRMDTMYRDYAMPLAVRPEAGQTKEWVDNMHMYQKALHFKNLRANGVSTADAIKKVDFANGGIVGLAAGGPVSWTPVSTARPTVSALPAIAQPAAFVAPATQQAIWQPAAAANPAVAKASLAQRNLMMQLQQPASMGYNQPRTYGYGGGSDAGGGRSSSSFGGRAAGGSGGLY